MLTFIFQFRLVQGCFIHHSLYIHLFDKLSKLDKSGTTFFTADNLKVTKRLTESFLLVENILGFLK